MDILLKVKEKGKQSISFTGGVSGLAGSFVGLSYQTNNFLGLGETLTLSAQLGNLPARRHLWLHRAVSVRPADLHRLHRLLQQVRLQPRRGRKACCSGSRLPSIQHCRKTTTPTRTGSLFSPAILCENFAFTRLGVTYGFSTTNITAFSQSAQLLFEFTQFRSLAGPSALSGIRVQQDYADDLLQHRRQSTEPHSREKLLLRAWLGGGALRRKYQHTYKYFYDDVLSSSPP